MESSGPGRIPQEHLRSAAVLPVVLERPTVIYMALMEAGKEETR
jgi:hypothetical protein